MQSIYCVFKEKTVQVIFAQILTGKTLDLSSDQRNIFGGQFKVPLQSLLWSNPNFLLIFLIIFAAPLQSPLIKQLLAVLYKPCFVLFPDDFPSSVFSP